MIQFKFSYSIIDCKNEIHVCAKTKRHFGIMSSMYTFLATVFACLRWGLMDTHGKTQWNRRSPHHGRNPLAIHSEVLASGAVSDVPSWNFVRSFWDSESQCNKPQWSKLLRSSTPCGCSSSSSITSPTLGHFVRWWLRIKNCPAREMWLQLGHRKPRKCWRILSRRGICLRTNLLRLWTDCVALAWI